MKERASVAVVHLAVLVAASSLACGSNTHPGSGGGGATTGTTSGSTASGTTSSSTASGTTSSSTASGAGCATTPTFTAVIGGPLSGCGGHEPPCHKLAAGGLQIDPADPAATFGALVNVDAADPASGKRVVPGDAVHSFLFRKLTNDLAATEGSPMPTSQLAGGWKELPADQIELVRCWIEGGAKGP